MGTGLEEGLDSILFAFEVDPMKVLKDEQQQTGVVHLLGELSHQDVRLLLTFVPEDDGGDVGELFAHVLLLITDESMKFSLRMFPRGVHKSNSHKKTMKKI